MSELTITKASVENLQDAARLFDAYRQYYGQPANLGGAERFLAERLTKGESVFFLAFKNDVAVGFAQLYPSFSSERPIRFAHWKRKRGWHWSPRRVQAAGY